MADIEKITAAAAPTDIPVLSSSNVSETGGASSSTAELGTSPSVQEPVSSNSHPHDSEYDTASDLEGGEDYDDDDDESTSDEESETDDDDDDDETDADDDDLGSGLERNAATAAGDSEAQKKVDEDRSNPQYIPKRGTFYEHDDRTAETEGDGAAVDPTANDSGPGGLAEPSSADADGNEVIGISGGAPAAGQPATISQASKTMKKWQPASGGDRWSHDRFEASEQAPKSRAELLQTYGYDIRNEDAAPRARRRRRYGRGPSKYSRNWEDEQAYLKASNKERKPPRPQDFPALNEQQRSGASSGSKIRARRSSTSRDEKENRGERRSLANGSVEKQLGTAPGSGSGAANAGLPAGKLSQDERKNRNYRERAAGGSNRQNPIEFKQKSGHRSSHSRGEQRDYAEQRTERDYHHAKPNANRTNGLPKNEVPSQQQHQQPHQQRQPQQQQLQHQQQQQQAPQQQKHLSHQPKQQQQQTQQQTPLVTSNLSQRLQQVQQRNDPSHVGSVQMHALASQNQQQQQQQQLHLQQQQQQELPGEHRNGPKRYSSLRRTQHEATQQQQQQQQQHLAEQQQMQQQLQLQQQQQQQQQSQIMLQDPHLLRLQMAYQQQELQVQLQTLQLGSAPPTAVATTQPKAAAYPQAQAAPSYYVTGGGEAVPVPVAVPQAPYVNPANAAYLPATPAAVAYAPQQQQQQPPPQQQQQSQPAPQATQSSVAQAAQAPAALNYHQNYNTVGGTTYFVSPAQTTTRPAVLPQRRPTNAIPILPPSEKHKSRGATGSGTNANPKSDEAGSSDNIDHIIDNMFVQRPAFQPPPTATSSTSAAATAAETSNQATGNKTATEDLNSNTTSSEQQQAAAAHQAMAVPGQE